MKKKLMAVLLLAGSSMLAAPRIAIGVGIGLPAAPAYVGPAYAAPAYVPAPAYVAPGYVPPAPAPGYFPVNGYWYFSGGHRLWHRGYWSPRAHFYGRSGWRR